MDYSTQDKWNEAVIPMRRAVQKNMGRKAKQSRKNLNFQFGFGGFRRNRNRNDFIDIKRKIHWSGSSSIICRRIAACWLQVQTVF